MLYNNIAAISFICFSAVHFPDSVFFLVKIDLLKNKFGFDEAFNYKEEQDLDAALKRSVIRIINSKSLISPLQNTLMCGTEQKFHHLNKDIVMHIGILLG